MALDDLGTGKVGNGGNEVLIGNDVIMIGYPKSLNLQLTFDYDRPLLRKGIIAGRDLKKKKIILYYFFKVFLVSIHSFKNDSFMYLSLTSFYIVVFAFLE